MKQLIFLLIVIFLVVFFLNIFTSNKEKKQLPPAIKNSLPIIKVSQQEIKNAQNQQLIKRLKEMGIKNPDKMFSEPQKQSNVNPIY